MKRRLITTMVALVLTLTFVFSLAACGGNANTPGASTPEDTAKDTPTDAPDGSTVDTPKATPVTIKWFWREGGDIQVPKDSYIVQKILKDININYEHITPIGMTMEEKLQTLLAIGDVPDIMESYNQQTSNLRKYGVIIPVDEYFTEEKLGNVMKNQNQWDAAAEMMLRSDGKSWAIPATFAALDGPVPYIRYDWLKKLNLEVPKTFDELAVVMAAFTNEDPDGNGENDTMGTSYGGVYGGFATNYGAEPFTWYRTADGVEIGFASTRMNDFVKYMKGLIDSGALNREIADPEELGSKHGNNIKAGKIGFSYTWNNVIDNDEIRKIQPNADWRPMVPPKGIYDKGYLPMGGILRQEYVISKACKDAGKVDAALALMNYMADDGGDAVNINYDAPYWEVSYGERGVNWDVTSDGKFDVGTFSESIKATNALNDYLGGRSKRFRTFAMQTAMNTGLRDDQKAANAEINTYPLMIDVPEGVGTPIFAEGLEVPQSVNETLKQMDQLWNIYYMKALLGQIDVDKGLDALRKDAEDLGYADAVVQMTDLLRSLGKIK